MTLLYTILSEILEKHGSTDIQRGVPLGGGGSLGATDPPPPFRVSSLFS